MKVITGSARGRLLLTVEGKEIVRPTTHKVKEAIFSAIQFDVPNARILDLFCGSGQMGIEALSQGADFCVFVDSNKKAHEITKQNLTTTNFLENSKVVLMDYKSYLISAKEVFDIAFLDPPYSKDIIEEALLLLSDKMDKSGIIICEHDNTDNMPTQAGEFTLSKQYHYGRICVTKYKHK